MLVKGAAEERFGERSGDRSDRIHAAGEARVAPERISVVSRPSLATAVSDYRVTLSADFTLGLGL
jgi:hypothetical protein